MTAKPTKVPVRRRALLLRINRKLIADGQVLQAARGSLAGCYYRIDTRRGCLIQKDVDLAELGRELGALRTWEVLV
jgi:hypothetical protein